MAYPSETDTYKAFQNAYLDAGGLMAWCRIEFRKWMKVDRTEACAIKAAGRGKGRCSKPCEFCISKLGGVI
jgi:hypothetical protein